MNSEQSNRTQSGRPRWDRGRSGIGKWKAITVALIGGAIVFAVGLCLPALKPAANCGGNNYALAACRQIVIYRSSAFGAGGTFDLTGLAPLDRTNLFSLATNSWTRGARFWMDTNGFKDALSRQIVVFCDVPHENVPPPTLWNGFRRNAAHAVAYSDGTVGLISPQEFERLDRQSFVCLTALATNFPP
ncbi:MAG: hypothetical protein ACK45B_05320 [Limisphaerales bacterium]